ncbi:hypothetical protein KMW28_12725 [Flammeovirga yaeyamensis]|uniref:Uncharacterized protein n=1 Tax=Flammeovirga yaeyamensis TaxID=367791 RepID=A0AAX1N365_9BACT|nr:hypothetical protein [Flammeovirga yaeyamensis]MBB3695967.1 hypothetical protein [Flammeovirga yaeyamensis]NMF34654.1 hypothetical protein [Flammeovirga yaeyamensis]QWG00517.1 hypothetical protein KMW28_12725 [Flammeovirga yaeyamensis]
MSTKAYLNQFGIRLEKEKFFCDYSIIQINVVSKWSYKDLFLDKVIEGVHAIMSKEKGKSIFLLADASKSNLILSYLDNAIKKENKGYSKPFLLNESTVKDDVLFQLLLNSLGNADKIGYSNITGQIFYKLKSKGKEQIALKIDIDENCVVSLKVTTFSPRRLVFHYNKNCSQDKRKKILSRPTYVFDADTLTFRRDLHESDDCYIQGKVTKTKNNVDFMGLNIEEFENTKIQVLIDILNEIKSVYSEYNLQFNQFCFESFCDCLISGNSFRSITKPIYYYNNTSVGVDIDDYLSELGLQCAELKSLNDVGENDFLLNIVNSKEFYTGKNDPHLKGDQKFIYQNIIAEQFNKSNSKKAYLSKVLQEMTIKEDIYFQKMINSNWINYKLINPISFYQYEHSEEERVSDLLILSISTNGLIEFDQKFFSTYIPKNDVFHKDKMTGSNVEGGIVYNNSFYIIEKTTLRSFPMIDWLNTQKKEYYNKVELSLMELREITESFREEYPESKSLKRFNDLKTDLDKSLKVDLSIEEVRKLFFRWGPHPLEKLLLSKIKEELDVKVEKGIKSSSDIELYGNSLFNLCYHKNGNEIYYWAQSPSKEHKFKLDKTNVIRKVTCVNGKMDESLIKILFEMMKVDFVRVNAPTVLPFPFKYLREHLKIGKIDFIQNELNKML